MAFCAFWMTVFASCADAIPAPSANKSTSMIHVFLAIIPPTVFPREYLCLDLGVRADYTSDGRLAHPFEHDWEAVGMIPVCGGRSFSSDVHGHGTRGFSP